MIATRFHRAAWLLFAARILLTSAAAQDPPFRPPNTPEEIQAEVAVVEGDPELDEATKSGALKAYAEANDALAKLKESNEAIARFDKMVATAEAETNQAKAKLAEVSSKDKVEAPIDETSLSELERQFNDARKKLDEIVERQTQLNAEPKRRTDRLAAIPEEVRDLETKLATVEKALSAEADSGKLTSARRMMQSIQQVAWTAAIAANEKERRAYEATEGLLRLQREIANAEAADAKAKFNRLNALVNERRKKEADEQARAAREAAEYADPEVADFAKKVAKLASERSELAEEIARASSDLQIIRSQLASVEQRFQRAKDRVDASGLSEAAGAVLRQERSRLPHVAELRRSMRAREQRMGDVRFSLYDLEDRENALANFADENHPDFIKQRILQRLGLTEAITPEVRELIEQNREILKSLIADSRNYIQLLIDTDAAEQRLIDETVAYSNYISERVLWIRSAAPLGPRDTRPAIDAVKWIGDPTHWRKAGIDLWYEVQSHWAWVVSFLLLFLILLLSQRRLWRYMRETGVRASKGSFSRFLPTVATLIATILVSIPWPLLAGFIGALLSDSFADSDFTTALGDALILVAWCWFPIEFIRNVARKGWLAEAHFNWRPQGMRVLRSQLGWLRIIGLPLLFVVAMTNSQTTEPLWSSSLGRAAFVALMALLAVTSTRVFHPTRGALAESSGYRRLGWFTRWPRLWTVLVAAAPIALAVLAIAGYFETARAIAFPLWATLCWVAALLVLRSLFARWVLVNRRRIALEQWRERKQAAVEKQGAVDESAPAVPIEPEAVNLAVVSTQTMKLIDTVILTLGVVLAWFVWIDILPALGILRDVPAWPGSEKPTLADVLLALAALIITYIASRNIPGLLELSVLKHLPLDAGARYAVASITRYVVVIVGVAMAGSFLGITWDSIQWLVAGVGIGLGFGLQEIFANFVSGIVLLFERPLRIGDLVSLGDTTGVVSKIRIRATTLTDLDNKEYIVPNKDLITGTLLNWTLSNEIIRVQVAVGVAYGSDVEKARRIMLDVAADHPRVLETPPSIATFEGFGDSTLNLVLRCFIERLEDRLTTISELHTAIDTRFKVAKIEIAFPQRDLHIRTVDRPIPLRKEDESPS